MKKKYLVTFQIRNYHDKVWCNVVPMDAFHILLGRLWQFDKSVIHDGRKNIYTIMRDGRKFELVPMEEDGPLETFFP